MIGTEHGIHTFSLKIRRKYSELQNIVEQNECIGTSKDKYGLSRYYQITSYKSIGVEILLSQSISRPCWLTLIVNPSSLLTDSDEPTALFCADHRLIQRVKHCLRGILDEIGVEERLKAFKLSRCDLTCNRYYESKRDISERLEIFRKSLLMPRYRVVAFGEYMKSDAIIKAADKHSWTIENKSKSCAFSVYDKAYELRKRHDIDISEHILRLELRFGRAKLTKITRSKDWEEQLIELGSEAEKQLHKFLHRLQMPEFDPVPLSELLDRINSSNYREKAKKKLRRIAKKANSCVSLAAVRKECRIKKSDFIKLLGKFEEMGVCCIPQAEKHT